MQYHKTDRVLTDAEVRAITDWTEDSDFSIKAKDLEQFILYVRIEDNAGNVGYIGSDGAIFDITAPEIVFADEPTGNLDTKTGEEVMELLKNIFKERNTTFILVSHDPDMRRYAGREIHIQDGIIRTEESVISGGKVI